MATQRRKTTLITLCGLLLAATAGCIDYQETIEVKPDGRIEVTIYATVLEAALPMVRNRPELQQLMMLPADAAATRELLPSTIKLKHWVIERGPGIRIFDVAVTLPTMGAFESELAPMFGDQAVQLFLDDDGLWHYRRDVEPFPFQIPEGAPRRMLQQRMEDGKLTFRLRVPTQIAETNGTRRGQHEVHWSTDLFELREQGVLMVARVHPPGGRVIPWAAAAGLALLAAVLFYGWRRRRQRR